MSLGATLKGTTHPYIRVAQLLRDDHHSVRRPLILALLTAATEGAALIVLMLLLGAGAASMGVAQFQNVPLLGELTPAQRIRALAFAIVAVMAVRGALVYASQRSILQLGLKVDGTLKRRLLRQAFALEPAYVLHQRQGRIWEIAGIHARQTGQLVQSVAGLLQQALIAAVYVPVLLFLSWQLTLLALVLLAAVTLIADLYFKDRLEQAALDVRAAEVAWRAQCVETVSGLREAHLFAQQETALSRVEQAYERVYAAAMAAGRLTQARGPIVQVAGAAALALLLAAATWVVPGPVDALAGSILLFAVIVLRLLPTAGALSQTHAQAKNLVPFLDSVLEFLQPEGKPFLIDGVQPFEGIRDDIRFENVSFRYGVHEPNILSDVSFTIARGKTTAVVGPSGAGKTTVVRLLTRMCDATQGCVSVDGTDLRDLTLNSWRRRLAVVSQDPYLLYGSVMENLRFARPDASTEEVIAAARTAQAHEFITALPQGYDTVLGNRGHRLSGGQQQRLAIARAILVDPQLLIFDEATSDLDSDTERAIQTAIAEFSRGRTAVIIAHRLATVRHADEILVLEDGRLSERGSHEQLLQVPGYYQRSVQAQSFHPHTSP